MASFDFQSLFTNVPGREVIRIMCDHVEQNELKIGIPVSVLVRQLLLCTTNVSFSFLGWAYRQIDGVAIGTPLSPILAHLFLAHLEEKASKILERSQLYKRYVDHVLVITISLEETTWIMDKLDRLHPNIRFTMETEIEDALHFLDIKMTRNNDGTMARSVYRKETWTGQCLQFDSFVSVEYERGLVRTLFQTARHICTEDMIDNELRQLKESLTRNAYPDAFIEKHSKPKLIRQTNCSAEKLLVTLCLPFIRDDINCLLKRPLGSALAQNKYYAPDLRIIHRTIEIPTPSVKQRPPLYTKSNLIYQFQCSCGATYVGRTERQLRNRVIEYIPNWVQRFVMQSGSDQRHNDNVRNHKIPSSAVGRRPSAVARHLLMTQHPADRTTAFRVIYVAKNTRLLSKFVLEDDCEDPKELEQQISTAVQFLLEGHFIDESTAHHLKPKGTRSAQLYGLPKLNKPGVPLGPILLLSMTNSPQHELAKWLEKLLEPVHKSMINVKGKHMASFDFQSLFTNVPGREVIRIMCDHVEQNELKIGIPVSVLVRQLLLCTTNVSFSFLGWAYRQIDGVAIGTPLSPILAHLFLAHLEEKASKILERSQLYKRYVDHVLVITISLEETTWIMDKLDRLHPNIRFTMETEIEDTLHFLDIKMTRNNDGTMARSVYRKETWTGQCLQFDSFVSVEYERGLVRTLFQTARHICT
ncbi:unnamed protein product [Fasciola hepatica]|uniref:Reverse transcriptase domain-containing protein n=1 Tax=Fasciola hepatica TaxID=6192 RepID=A0ABC9HGH7_FASHE